MHITKPVALLVCESIPQDSKNFVKPKKENEISINVTKTQSPSQKEHERFLESDFFVHWASFDCK